MCASHLSILLADGGIHAAFTRLHYGNAKKCKANICTIISPLLAPCRQTFDGGYKWSVRTFGNLDEEEEINYRFQKVGT